MGLFDTLIGLTPMGMAAGKGPIAGLLGLSGKQGDFYKPGATPSLDQTGVRNMKNREAIRSSGGMSKLLEGYGTGKMSLTDALGGAEGLQGAATARGTAERDQRYKEHVNNMNAQREALKDEHGWDDNQFNEYVAQAWDQSEQGQAANTGEEAGSELRRSLATDPLTGSRLATDQVRDNAILGKLYGEGGALDRSNVEEQELAKRGFSLQPEDYEAYGQASGNVARMFGTQEQGLSQSLADRGLGAAPSGAAGVGFTGIQGNKMEHLAGLQRQIADNRMNMNLKRLNDTRDYMTKLGGMGENAIQNQYARNLSGVENAQGQDKEMADQLMSKYAGDISAYKGANEAGLASQEQKTQNKGQTLFEGLGRGLFKAAESAPSKLMSKAMG